MRKLEEKNLSAAVSLAMHYRDLNQPEEAESICRDVLDVAPDNEAALRTLGLALTDRFLEDYLTLFDEACATFARLGSPYERVYYAGIAWERYGKAQLRAGRAHNALHAYEEAIERFEEAERLGPRDEPAAILHYNHCVRALGAPELVHAASIPPRPKYEFGD